MAQAAEEFPPVEEVTLPPSPQRTSPSAAEDMTISDLQALRYDTQSKQQSIEAQRLQDQATREQMQKAAAPKIAETQDALKGVEGAAQTITQQQTPPLPQPPKLADFLNKDAANMMMAIASVVAGFNSNGRVRGIRANRALAAGINGYVAGNLEVAKLGLEDWKNQMTLQLHENEQIRQKNLDILNASKLTLEAKKQAFDLEMAPYGMKLDGYKANLGYLEKSVELNKEMAQIDESILKALKVANPAIQKLSTEQYKILMAQRAQGIQTGDPMVDKLTPDQAKKMAGLEPKPTQAQTKARDQLIGTSNVLKEIEALIPEMDQKGFLAKGPSKASAYKAEFNRWSNSADPTLAKWKSLQGSIVGFDRSVFNDIGARVKSAYEGSLNLFDQPFTAQGLRDAIGGYRRILEDSPEAKRALAENPEALSGGGPRLSAPSNLPAGGQVVPGKIAVIRKSDGQPGIISEQFFDPSKYTKVPEGQPIQAR